MISILKPNEQKDLSSEILEELERNILIQLGFYFNYSCPIISMERYLRILNIDQDSIIYNMTSEVLKFQLNDSNFLKYRPS